MNDRTCSIVGCEKLFSAKGMCTLHYQRMRLHGTPYRDNPIVCIVPECQRPFGKRSARGLCNLHYKEWNRARQPICRIDECNERTCAQGMCSMHYQRVLKTGSTDSTVLSNEELFWTRVEITGFCWNWTGYTHRDGYGYFGHGSVPVRVHRFAYELLIGPIADGMQLDHLCRNRRCMNPDHLEPVTPRENTMRGFGITRFAAQATHCPQGHEYAGFNLYVTREGWRQCRTCRTENSRRSYARKALRMHQQTNYV